MAQAEKKGLDLLVVAALEEVGIWRVGNTERHLDDCVECEGGCRNAEIHVLIIGGGQ